MKRPRTSSALVFGAVVSLIVPGSHELMFAVLGAGGVYVRGVEVARAGKRVWMTRIPWVMPRLVPFGVAASAAWIERGLGWGMAGSVLTSAVLSLAIAFAASLAGYRAGVRESRVPGRGWRRLARHYLRDVIYGPSGWALIAMLAGASLATVNPSARWLSMVAVLAACGMIAVRDEPFYIRKWDLVENRMARAQLQGVQYRIAGRLR
jgi:hypothetical protein